MKWGVVDSGLLSSDAVPYGRGRKPKGSFPEAPCSMDSGCQLGSTLAWRLEAKQKPWVILCFCSWGWRTSLLGRKQLRLRWYPRQSTVTGLQAAKGRWPSGHFFPVLVFFPQLYRNSPIFQTVAEELEPVLKFACVWGHPCGSRMEFLPPES